MPTSFSSPAERREHQATPQPSQLRSGRAHCRSLGCPGFPVKVGGVANCMRFSLQKTAHAALSSAANRKSGCARDDKRGGGSVHLSSCYKGLRELSAEREANDPSIHITNCRGRNKSTLCHPDPDFLYVAPSMTACAAFSKESRMRFANANELHRKSGGAKPRDLQFLSPLRRLAAQSTS
jgi:hypothetical protein